MRFIYSLLLYLLIPFVVLRLTWLGFRNRQYWARWPERFGFGWREITKQPVIWLHAVSVGEVKAAAVLIERLAAEFPSYNLLITTVTPGGAALVRQIFGDRYEHVFLPYDLPHAVRRFITGIRPRILLVMETEIWPNLYHHCHRMDVPIVMINARISDQSYRGYHLLPVFSKQVLGNVQQFAAQTEADGRRLAALGADVSRIMVTGNIKFDMHMPVSIKEEAEAVRRGFSSNRPVWIAASTHEGEDDPVLEAHRRVLAAHPSALLIIAPRHPERAAKINSLANSKGFACRRKTDAGNGIPSSIQVFIVDTLGELPVFYAASDIAFVGGSLVPHGGHNVLEPASLGIPVITGPHMHNFREIQQLLQIRDAIIQVENERQLAVQIEDLLTDGSRRYHLGESARTVVEQNRGSVDKVMRLIIQTMQKRTNE